MTKLFSGTGSARTMRRLLVLCLALIVFGGLVPRTIAAERWLLIFDTSAGMKKRLPALQETLKKILGSGMGDNIHTGDSVGVWTFDSKVHPGDYPLFTWQPDNAIVTVTNLMTFVRKQKFSGETDFDALEPLIDRVIQHSERLTILIFCDGDGQVNWTPYNDGINANLQQGMEERAKHKLPVIMIARTQQGKFVGVTINYPPLPPTFSAFPPIPVVTKTVAAPPPAPTPPPVVTLPPLVIVGTTESTDVTATARYEATNKPVRMEVIHPAPAPVTPPPAEPAPAAPAPAELTPTNAAIAAPAAPAAPMAAETTTPPANPPVAPLAVPAITKTVTTNSVAASTGDGGDRSTRMLLFIGAILFGLALLLVLWLALRPRRPQHSLITSLMSEDPKYRK